MKYRIDPRYRANGNSFTFGLITLLMLGFAAVAQSEGLVTGKPNTFSDSLVCVEFVPGLCQQISEIQTQTSNPQFLIQ